jgi:hypothetical protein
VVCDPLIGHDGLMVDQRFVCPRCRARSSNPGDVAEGYCGACHEFTGKLGYLVGGPGHGQLWPWPEDAAAVPDRLAVQAVVADVDGTADSPLRAEPLVYQRAHERHTTGLWLYTAPGVELTKLRARMAWPPPDENSVAVALTKWAETAALDGWAPVDGLRVEHPGNAVGSLPRAAVGALHQHSAGTACWGWACEGSAAERENVLTGAVEPVSLVDVVGLVWRYEPGSPSRGIALPARAVAP